MKGWFSFGTNARRAKESALQAVGVHQATEDDAFEKKYTAFKVYIADLEKILESFQIYLECFELYNSMHINISRSLKKLHSGGFSITGNPKYKEPTSMETVSMQI